MDAGEPKTAGALLRKIRSRKNLTVEVVAGRAGISVGFLSQVEQGIAVLGRLAHWRGVADALGMPLSELMRLDVPAPGNGHTASGTEAIQNALAVLLHVRVMRTWLNNAEAPTDLRRQAMFLARRLAQEHNVATSLASAAYGLAGTLVVGGSFELAQTVLDGTPLPPVTGDTAGLVRATLVSPQAQLLAIKGGDPIVPLAEAAEIADRFGEVGAADPYGFGFGPTNVGFWRIRAALELGDVDDAVRSVRAVRPERTPFQASQAFYWRSTVRALTLAGGPVDDAIRAHLKAEAFLPVKLYRNLRTREVLRNLLTRHRTTSSCSSLPSGPAWISVNPSHPVHHPSPE